MTKVLVNNELYSIRARQKIGIPNSYGFSIFGWSQYGTDNALAGIYRMMRYGSKFVQVKMRFFDNPITHTPAQTARRTKFRNAVIAWQALSPDAKKEYNRLAVGYHYFGYHLFIKRFMNL